MRLTRLALPLLVLAFAASPAALAAGEDGELDAVGHTADGFYLDFKPIGIIELPRLFVVRDAEGALGFDAFGSTAAAIRSNRYVAVPEDEPGTGDVETLTITGGGEDPYSYDVLDAGGHIYAELAPADGGEIVLDLSITRHLMWAWFATFFLLVLFLPMGAKYKKGIGRTSAPRGRLQNGFEAIIVYIRDEIAKPNLGDKYRKYLPYLLTAFFFILFANILGLVPWGAAITSNLTATAVLAGFTFVLTQLAGTKDYWAHIFNPPGIPAFVKPILIPVEILGLFTKPIALAIRLFANIAAGHLVILNLIGLIFIIGSLFGAAAGYATSVVSIAFTLFIYVLKILVSFIQAYVFTVLSALFIGMASAEHEHDHDHAEDHPITAHDVAVSRSNGQAVHQQHERTVGTEAAMA